MPGCGYGRYVEQKARTVLNVLVQRLDCEHLGVTEDYFKLQVRPLRKRVFSGVLAVIFCKKTVKKLS